MMKEKDEMFPNSSRLPGMVNVFICFLPLIGCQPRASQESKVQKLSARIDHGVKFWGRVVDNNDQPISDVEIQAVVKSMGSNTSTTISRISDKDGKFEISGIKGYLLQVIRLRKNGYDPKPYWDSNGAEYSVGKSAASTAGALFENPAIFKLRLMGERSFLLKYDESIRLKFPLNDIKTEQGIDLIERTKVRINSSSNRYNSDIIGKIVINKNRKVGLQLGVEGVDNGLLITNKQQNEAPDFGYSQSEVVYTGMNEVSENSPLYIYIKSRSPSIYSCVEVSEVEFKEAEVSLKIRKIIVNPYGFKTFEELDSISPSQYLKYKEDVINSFRAGRIPIKPRFNESALKK